MVLTAALQVSTVLVAVLTLVWHQSRTIDGLRKEARRDHRHLMKLQAKATRQARKDNEKLRAEFTSSQDKLETSHNKLWDVVIENGRKLDRIEGFLGLGMPELAAERAAEQAAGSAFGPTRPGLEDQPEEPQAGADEDD